MFSVVIAAHNEAESIARVLRELAEVLPRAGGEYEIICVDDGSTDATAACVTAVMAEVPGLRLLRHAHCAGKSRAVATGVYAARGAWIATMDADGQNDPVDVVAMVELARQAAAPVLVAGLRARRRDTWSKRAASVFANRFRRLVLNDACPDTGCGLKTFPRAAFVQLPVFEGMHRYYPALFKVIGLELIMHQVTDRPRLAGQSKYTNLGRALVGIPDMLTVVWLRHRIRATGPVTETGTQSA